MKVVLPDYGHQMVVYHMELSKFRSLNKKFKITAYMFLNEPMHICSRLIY